MSTNNIITVSTEQLQAWQPAFESTIGAEQYSSMPNSRKRLLVGIAMQEYAKLSGASEADMSIMMPSNVQLASNVLNPQAAGPGLTPGGTTGSGDRQFLVGICVAIAAKTVGLDLLQSVPVTSANVTLNHLNVIYNGGSLNNAANDSVKVVTVEFDKVPKLVPGKKYVIGHDLKNATANQWGFIEVTAVKPDKKGAKFYVFTVGHGFTATNNSNTLTGVTYISESQAIATILADGKMFEIDAAMSTLTDLADSVKAKAVEHTKAVQNHIPGQTTKGLGRTLTRSEADAGTDHKVELDLTSTAHVVGNRVFVGHLSRLQEKRLEEGGIAAKEILAAAMKNEVSQELNYQIINTVRTAGLVNHMAYQLAGTNFNTFIGPQSVTSIPFANLPYAKELKDHEGNAVAFPDLQNLSKTLQFEQAATLGTYLCMQIAQAAYAIGTDSRFGEGDAVVLASNLAGFVSASSKFTPLKATGSVDMSAGSGAKLSGYIDGIKVYVDVNAPMNSPYVTVLRTGNGVTVDVPGVEQGNVLIPGYACVVKDLVSSVELVPSGTGGKKIIMDSEADLVKIGEAADQAYLTFAFYAQIPGIA